MFSNRWKSRSFQSPKSYRKATEKPTEKQQTVENQALDETLFGFSVLPKRPHQTRPHPPTDQSVSWHDFCRQGPRFFYTFQLYWKTEKKSSKSLKIKGLRLFGGFFGSFSVAFRFLAPLLKTCYTKHPTLPHPLLSTTVKTLWHKHLLDIGKSLKIKGFTATVKPP